MPDMPLNLHQLFAMVIVAGLLGTSGCATMNMNPSTWQLRSLAGESAPPGTAEWWKKHKRRAEFVPGKGYQVAGVEGYFDQEGRPMKSRAAIAVKEKKKNGLLSNIQVAGKINEMKSQLGYGTNEDAAEQAYALGEDLFRRQEYGQAAKQFKKAIDKASNSLVEQNAMFFFAESLFFSDKYPKAVEAYEELLDKYPNSSHLDEVIRRQFDIAHYWEKYHQHKPHWAITPNLFDKTRPLFDTRGNALKTYENIRLNDPTGPLADDSIMATANSHFLNGRYGDADYYYGLLRREYPRSDHQYEAHILGLQSKLRIYQGPDYVSTPLLEAKELIKQLKTQFGPDLSTEERERLAEIEGTLVMQLAARDFKRAKGYDENKHYESARMYYSQVVRDYPDTPLAEKARKRFMEIGGKPAHPETKMQWLVDLFPENAERTAIAQVQMVERENPMEIAKAPISAGEETTVR